MNRKQQNLISQDLDLFALRSEIKMIKFHDYLEIEVNGRNGNELRRTSMQLLKFWGRLFKTNDVDS